MNLFIRQGRAIPDEVRSAIVERYLENKSIRNIAQEVNLSYQTVSNIVDLWIETGSVEPRNKRAAPTRARKARTDHIISFIEYLKQKQPSIYGKEIQQQLLINNVCLPENIPSLSSISRILTSDLGYSYKQIEPIAREAERPDIIEKLEEYIAVISGVECNRLHFFDESSVVVTSGNRRRGHSAVGTPAIEVQRYASNATYTVNLLHNVSGISYFNILRGASNGLELINFFEEAMEQGDIDGNPVIKDNDVIVMDNCGFHHGNNVEPHLRDMLEERHAHLIYQPPYHPCYNTCEACFSHTKKTLRRYPKYTEKHTELCISDALGLIKEGLSRQFFKFCGYI